MSGHTIHHTKSIVLSSKTKGEADKIFTLYTKELGLIKANAQGIRLEKSKSRFSIQDFSFAEIDLVRGKEFWRITSTRLIDYFPLLRKDKKSVLIIAQISRLLIRLCAGEESNQKIFNVFLKALTILNKDSVKEKDQKALELYLVLKIVYELGYVGDFVNIQNFIDDTFDESKVDLILKERISIISNINKALKESHL